MNWKELKDFCNSLDDEQLQENVSLINDGEDIENIGTAILNIEYNARKSNIPFLCIEG